MPLKWRCVNVFGHNSFMLSMLKNNMMLPLYLKKNYKTNELSPDFEIKKDRISSWYVCVEFVSFSGADLRPKNG